MRNASSPRFAARTVGLAALSVAVPAPLPLLAALALLSGLGACGGSAGQAPAAASPDGLPQALADGGAPSATAPSTPTTTTMTLGDAGDLQGTKLQASSSSSSTADMPDAGPARGPHEQEAGRSVKDIQVIVQAHRDEARACYDQAQQVHPDPTVKGNLHVKWTIDPTGKVTDLAVDDATSDIHDPAIGQCVMNVIRGIHFAVSAKGFETHAHYPFNFNPHNLPRSQPH